MSSLARLGAALLLVTVCMVRAYPQSLNQTATGRGEYGQNGQLYAQGMLSSRSSRSNKNSGPTIDNFPPLIQNTGRNQQRQFPGDQGYAQTPGPDVSGWPTGTQPHRSGHHSRLASAQQTASIPHNNQQTNRRAQYRSIQTRNEDVPRNNEDQNRIVKQSPNTVNSNERPTPTSRAYTSPHDVRSRFSEELKMPPQDSTSSQSRGHTTVPAHQSNATSTSRNIPQDSFGMPRIPSRSSSGSSEGIVFPDQKLIVPRLGKGGPKCANGLTFCEDVDGYPIEHITGILRKELSTFKLFSGTDTLVPELVNRLSQDEELCKYNEHIAYPKVGQNKDEEWAWIANTADFKQGVRVEVCQNTGNECQLVSNWPMGYKTECKQKHIYRRLLSMTSDGTPSTDEFLFPSCCVCSVTNTARK